MELKQMQQEAWQNSEDHGFHEGENSIPRPYLVATKLDLIHSELSEVLEEERAKKPVLYYGEDGKPEGMAAEIADVVIRCGDFAGIFGFDLEQAVIEKMAYNKSRPYKHGKTL